MEDTRSAAIRFFDRLEFSSGRALTKIGLCLILAFGASWLSSYDVTLGPAGRSSLFILVLAAGLWATEAIPAFAVALLVVGLQIAILGRPGGVYAQKSGEWEQFAATLGSPLIWLFFGGFTLAAAADKTGLNRALARQVLQRLGTRPGSVLAGCMAITFVFSMFISNTAAATMMIAVMLPLVQTLGPEDRFRKAMLLGIAFSANMGGMGTVIGSPPNAIAAGALSNIQPIDFFHWMLAGFPPATLMIVALWGYLMIRYPSSAHALDFSGFSQNSNETPLPLWKRLLVVIVFVATVTLWLTQSLHGVPSTVIAFVPICVFCTAGILDGDDVCGIRWDVLLLIAGGLSLGLAVTQTGLATWIVGLLPMNSVSKPILVLMLAYTTLVLSNVMSNTAAANILVPIGIVVGSGTEAATVVPLAISASAAMCLPISTPPNAIAYGTGQVQSSELIQGGLWIGIVAPLVATAWCAAILS